MEEDFRHGIQQLRCATPALLRTVFDFGLYGHASEALAIHFTKIFVTNAPLRLLRRGTDIEKIKAASTIEDISQKVETALLYSDYGPDFEDHFRSIFETGLEDRMEAARVLRDNLEAQGKVFRLWSDPVRLVEEFSKGRGPECKSVGTQFFVTTLDGLPSLVRSLKQACRQSYLDRKRVKSRRRHAKS